MTLAQCANVPLTISAVIVSPLRLATLHELQTVYGSEDLVNFLEVIQVHGYNERLIAKSRE